MTQKIWLVITNCGDGSNGIEVLKTQQAIDKVQELANQGYEQYASGDGLQITELSFPDEFAVDAWVIHNFRGYADEEILDPNSTFY